jgi:hypothetical protein
MHPSDAPRGYWVCRRPDGCYLGEGSHGVDRYSPDPRFALCWSDRRQAIDECRKRASERLEVVPRPGAKKAPMVAPNVDE